MALCESSQQLNLAHLSALTQLQLRGDYKLASGDRLPANLTAATLLCGGDAAVLLPQLSRLQQLELGDKCMLAAAQLTQLPSWLPTLTQLHLAYSCKTFPSPPNLAAEAAAWPGLPLRQLSLHGLSVPVAVLQRLAELPGGVRSLELNFCKHAAPGGQGAERHVQASRAQDAQAVPCPSQLLPDGWHARADAHAGLHPSSHTGGRRHATRQLCAGAGSRNRPVA